MALTAKPGDPLVAWFERARLGPVGLGIALALGYLALFSAQKGLQASLGFREVGLTSGAALAAAGITGALLGYLLAMNALLHRGLRRDLDALRPLMTEAEGRAERLREASEAPPGLLAGASLLGAAIGGTLPYLDPNLRSLFANASVDDPDFLWSLVQNVVLTALGVRVFAAQIHWTRSIARIGREAIDVDLLEPSGLAPFSRYGQRSVIAWVGLTIVFSMYWVSETAARANVVLPFAIAAALSWIFVAPLAGVRSRIRTVKQAELARVAAQIREERERVLAPRAGGRADDARPAADPLRGSPASSADPSRVGRLADLVAYRGLVADFREWPIDVPGVLRFALFLLLGLGSWLGGALVERGLDAVWR